MLEIDLLLIHLIAVAPPKIAVENHEYGAKAKSHGKQTNVTADSGAEQFFRCTAFCIVVWTTGFHACGQLAGGHPGAVKQCEQHLGNRDGQEHHHQRSDHRLMDGTEIILAQHYEKIYQQCQ